MRLLLVCVGRSKAGPERDLAARYIERAAAAGRAIGFSAVELREAGESRAARPDDRKRDEAKAIRALLPPRAKWIALDETGKHMTSRDLATELGRGAGRGDRRHGLRYWRPGRFGTGVFDLGFAHALFWDDDLAAPIGANHGRRADLPGDDDSFGAPLSS